MTGRQRVRRCLDFACPDRVPRELWLLPIARLEHGDAAIDEFCRRWPSDIAQASWAPPPSQLRIRGNPHAIGSYRDEWGCTFENIQAGVIGEVKHPLIDDWSRLEGFRPPGEWLNVDADQVNRFCTATDQFVRAGCCPRPFERLQFLRGSENLYLDLAEESGEFLTLLGIVADFYRKELEAWSRTNVDGLMFMDDWGSQRALLIAPRKWRRLFKPLYAEYARIAHARGKKIFMHSDGYIFDILEDLVEIGIDAINCQLFCMDIEEIGRRFKGRITFWGEIDRQHILPHGTPGDARAAVRRVCRSLYSPGGGVIAQFELGAAAKLPNAHAVFAAWDELAGALRAGGAAEIGLFC